MNIIKSIKNIVFGNEQHLDPDNWHRVPINDADIRGIYEFLAWKFRRNGFSSNDFHYLEVLYREAENSNGVTLINSR